MPRDAEAPGADPRGAAPHRAAPCGADPPGAGAPGAGAPYAGTSRAGTPGASPRGADAALAFVRARRALFGLAGENNRVPDAALRPKLPPPRRPLSAGGHFRFGYDAEPFAARAHGAQRYWTEYGRPAHLHDGFAAELLRAVGEIAALAGGRISVSAGAGYVGRAVLAVARRLRLDVEQVAVEIDGVAPRVPERTLRCRRRRASFDEFAAFARGFGARVGCADPWIALEAFHAAATPRLHVCDGVELKLMNHGVDPALGRVVAPADWTLVDNEKFTALDRWLIATDRPGIAQVLRWSPELVAAQLDSAPYRAWLAATARASGAVTRGAWTNQAARLRLFREAFPGLELAPDARAAWGDAGFAERMRLLGRELRHANPGCAQQHHAPLARIAARLAIDLGPAVAAAGRIYGAVAEPDAAVPRAPAGEAPAARTKAPSPAGPTSASLSPTRPMPAHPSPATPAPMPSRATSPPPSAGPAPGPSRAKPPRAAVGAVGDGAR